MLTPDDVLNPFRGLECVGLRRPDAIDTEGKLRATARVWCEVLGPTLDAAGLSAAIRAHLADPVRGRFWPTVADILTAAGARPRAVEGAVPLRLGTSRVEEPPLEPADERLVHAAAVATFAVAGCEEPPDAGTLRELRRIFRVEGRAAVEVLLADALDLVADDQTQRDSEAA